MAEPFVPNTVAIPLDWIDILERHPEKLSGFIARVRVLYAAQIAAFTPAKVVLPAPSPEPEPEEDEPEEDGTISPEDDFHQQFAERLALEFPDSALPPRDVTDRIYAKTVADGATPDEAVAAVLDLIAKLMPRFDTQGDVGRLALIALKNHSGWASVKAEADSYRKANDATKANMDRRRHNAALDANPPAPAPETPSQEWLAKLRAKAAKRVSG
jgi:hypothetical protein